MDAPRVCSWCNEPLPEGAPKNKAFCSDRCQLASWQDRKAAEDHICLTCKRIHHPARHTRPAVRSFPSAAGLLPR